VSDFEKYRAQLERLLDDLKEISDNETLFTKWFKIVRICKESLANFSLTPMQKQTLQTLLMKYKTGIEPKLNQYIREQRYTAMAEQLDFFRERLYRLFDQSEQELSTLPLHSLEILEDTLFFVDLFKFRFNKDLIKIAKEIVRKKMQVLKASFEKEAGAKDLEAQEKQLTAMAKSSFEGVSFPEPIAMPEIKSELTTDSEPMGDMVVGKLEFPEEVQTVSKSTSPPIPSSSPTPQSIPELPTNPAQTLISVYPYSMWVSKSNPNQFMSLRYSSVTGRPNA